MRSTSRRAVVRENETRRDEPGGSASAGGLGRWSEHGPASEQDPDGRLAKADQEGKRVLKENLHHINLPGNLYTVLVTLHRRERVTVFSINYS